MNFFSTKICDEKETIEQKFVHRINHIINTSYSLRDALGNNILSFLDLKKRMVANYNSDLGALFLELPNNILYVTHGGVHIEIYHRQMNYGEFLYEIKVAVYYSEKNTLINELKNLGFGQIKTRRKICHGDETTISKFAFENFSSPFIKSKRLYFKTPYGNIPLRDIEDWLLQIDDKESIMSKLYKKLCYDIEEELEITE